MGDDAPMSSLFSDPSILSQTIEMMKDPTFMQKATEMMSDPSFFEQTKQMMNDPQMMEQMEKLASDPTFVDKAESMMKDPTFMEQTKEMVKQSWLPFVGKPVRLEGLTNESYNGLEGRFEGMDEKSGRCRIWVNSLEKIILIKDENCIMKEDDENEYKPPPVDEQDQATVDALLENEISTPEIATKSVEDPEPAIIDSTESTIDPPSESIDPVSNIDSTVEPSSASESTSDPSYASDSIVGPVSTKESTIDSTSTVISTSAIDS